MTENARVRLSWGQGSVPIQQIDGAREALQALFGFCPEFEATDTRGVWLVELPAEFTGFPFLTLTAGVFTLTKEH
ncbi:hypothetical protein [Nonomuraea sp. NPDC048826]|uniref:hypothetical protein n=1 Tax=Nonomuraea sp. NPDC048826 TaxID=3364347 RepID=UPI0037232E46